MIDNEIARVKRALLAVTPQDSSLASLATTARDLLVATGGQAAGLTPLPKTPADLRAYGLLAILQAEGRRAGYGSLTLEDRILAGMRAVYAGFNPEMRAKVIETHAVRFDAGLDRDLIGAFLADPSTAAAEAMMADLGPAIDAAAMLVIADRLPAIPAELMNLLRRAYAAGYGTADPV
jgi:hypothetical protein